MLSTDGRKNSEIGRAVLRLEAAVAARPGFGHVTHVSSTRSVDGLSCETLDGGHLIASDLPRGLGGVNGAPSPGSLLRAALGSCLAMGYRLRAERHGVDLGEITVHIETDSVLAGMLDPTAGHRPGFGRIRARVRLETTSAPERDLRALIEEADRLSPVLDVVQSSNIIECTHHLERGDR